MYPIKFKEVYLPSFFHLENKGRLIGLFLCSLIYLSGCLGNGGSGQDNQDQEKNSVGKVELTVFDNYQPANGDSAITVLAAVRDANNVPLSSLPIEVSTTSPTAFFIMQDKQTDEQGLATVGFFNTKAETFDVAIASQGIKSLPISLTFVTPTSALEVTTQENIVPVGGTVSLTVMARQTSTGSTLGGEAGKGNTQNTESKPLPHAPVSIEVSGAAKVDKDSVETNEHGLALFKVTDGIAEKVMVTVRSGSVTQSLPLFFGASLSLLPTSSNAIEKTTLTAVLKDSNNAPLAGQAVSFSFIGKNNEILSPPKALTSEEGTATVTITDLEKNGGTAIVNATVGSSFSTREPATVNFLASFGQDRHLEVKTSAHVLTLEQSATITARVVDKFNEPVKGQLIKFSVTSPQGGASRARVHSPQGITNELGEAQTQISNTLGENVVVNIQADTARQEIPLYFGAILQLVPPTANGIADGTTPVLLTATLNDASGAGIIGIPVNFRITQGAQALLDAFQGVTDEMGRTQVGVTNHIPDHVIVQASADVIEHPQAELTFLAPNSAIELKTNSKMLPVGGEASISVSTTQKIEEIEGAPFPHAPLIITVSGEAQLKNIPYDTDSFGKASFTVTTDKPETIIVTVASGLITQTLTLYFGATLSLVPSASDALEKATLTALLKDGQNVPITGEVVNFSFIGTNNKSLSPTSAKTDAEGTVQVIVNDLAKEQGQVIVQAKTGNLSAQASVTFKDKLSAIELETNSKALSVGGEASISVSTTQKVEEREGVPFPHAPLTISVSGKAQLKNIPSNTNSSGRASFTVSSNQPETVIVTVSSGTMTQTLTLYFGATLSLVPSASNAVEKTTLTALLKDGQNVPIIGEVITFGFVGTNNKTLSPTSAKTSAEGTAQVIVNDLAKEKGSVIVQAKTGNLSAQAMVTFKDNLLDDRVAHLKLVVSNDFQPADGKSSIILTIIALDEQNIPVSGLQVSLLSHSNNAFFDALTGKTENNGRFTTRVTNSIAETVEVTPLAGGIKGDPVTITFVSSNLDRRVSTVRLMVTNNSQAADGRSPITVTVIARDSSGMPISNVQVHLISSSETALLEKINGTTEDNGRFSTTVISSVPETFTVTAVAGGIQSNIVTLTFSAPVGTIVLRASELLLDTNDSSRVTVTILRKVNLDELLSQFSEFFDYVALDSAALDSLLQKDVLLPHTPFNVSVSGNALLSDVPAVTNTTGQASFTITDKHAEDVTVTVTSGSVAQTLKLYFGASLSLIPVQSNAVGNTQLRVLLNNGYQSPLAGQKINFSFEQSNYGTLSPPSVTTGEDGTAEVTVTNLNNDGGISVVKATAGQLTAQATINFLAQIGDNLFEVKSSATLLDLGYSATITATIKDKVGIPIVGQPVNFALTLADGGNSHARWVTAENPQGIETTSMAGLLTNEKGEVQIIVTDDVGENVLVVAQVGATTQKIPLYFGASIQALPLQGETNAGGSPFTLKASVQDASKGGISKIPVNFRVLEGKALLSTFSSITDQVGVAEVEVTNQTAEKTIVEAHADTLVSSSTIDFIASEAPYKIVLKTDPPQESVTLPLNGTVQIIAVVTDDRGLPVRDGIRIYFSSTGQVGTEPIGSVTESAFTKGGEAIAIFNAGTLAGLTTVEATSSIAYQVPGGQSRTASAGISLVIESGEAGSIEVKEIKPKAIGIKGSGIAQSATIQFMVKDNLGNPVKDDTEVEFSLGKTTLGGGETISVGERNAASTTAAIGKTNNGLVSVTLKSGTIAGNVDVIAKVEEVSTLARVIIVGSLPDADHLSLATEYLNIAGGVRFGLRDQITAYVGDRFGNVVTDGTTVSFITEGGTIGKGIGGTDNDSIPFTTTTAFGQATADLQSAGPSTPYLGGIPTFRRSGYVCSGQYQESAFSGELCGNPGWVTVVAYTTGSESFVDANGNGIFDGGDRLSHSGFVDTNKNSKWNEGEPITGQGDMSEPFIDGNDNSVFDAGELYIDVNKNGRFDGPDGIFQENTTIWTAIRVLFSARTGEIKVEMNNESLGIGESFSIFNNQSKTFHVKSLGDVYGNALVSNSRFRLTSNGGVLSGTTELTFKDSLGRGENNIYFTLASKPPSVTQKKDAQGKEITETTHPLPTPVTLTISIDSPASESAPGGNGSSTFVISGTVNVPLK